MRQDIKLIVVCVLVGGVGGVLLGLLLPKAYRAQATLQYVAPEMDTQGDLLSRIGGGGLLAGLAGATGENKAAAVAILRSRVVVNSFIENNRLAPRLFDERWDLSENKWKDGEDSPTPQELYRRFAGDLLRVTTDQSTGLVVVSIKWSNAAEAAEWVNGLVAVANSYLKSAALAEGERNVSYLSQQVFETTPIEVREAAGSLLAAELRRVMVARGRSEFAFKSVEPAAVPDLGANMGLLLMAAAGGSLGALLGLSVAFIRRYWAAPMDV
jgi:uncharacterized protein involved in exopolysaccharide biosynthesis